MNLGQLIHAKWIADIAVLGWMWDHWYIPLAFAVIVIATRKRRR